MTIKNIGIVGSGVIADIHAEALANLPGVKLVAVADISSASANTFARKWNVEHTFTSAEELANSGIIDVVHISTPPDSHAKLASLFLEKNVPAFTEKPVGTSAEDLALLEKAAKTSDAILGVNQNSIFHPAFQKALKIIEAGDLGTVQSVQCHYAAPLRQLDSGQFSHWMFQKPINILLEQAVHPLAQIACLTGQFEDVQTLTAPAIEIGDGKAFYPTTLLNLIGNKGSAQLHYSVGSSYTRWQLDILLSDGVISVDIISNRVTQQGRSQWLEATEHFVLGKDVARQTKRQARSNFLSYAASMIGLKSRNDAFYLGMKASIANFYAGLSGQPARAVDLDFTKNLIEACLTASSNMKSTAVQTSPKPPREKVDVVILGGTGFIGRYVTEQCLAKGYTVRVIARNLSNLPAVFSNDNVDLVAADMKKTADAATAVKGTDWVINLAHGGGGSTPEQVLSAMLGSAEAVYNACKEAGVKRLIHMGSIAGLYLGDPLEIITGSTAPDPQPNKRGDYAMAKALTDERMLALGSEDGPEITILRPGIVVGKGTAAAHSGLGVFNNEQHCLGWSSGEIALPFVLASDVASATVACLTAPDLKNKCYNLVGDVRLTAKEYFADLRAETGRAFQYHPQSPAYITFIENIKILIKRIAGKKQHFHSLRDFRSRAMYAQFDCEDAKQALNWTPIAERDQFNEQAISIHRK